ncbi:carboxypeptidase inhibitor SmCI-like isoform X2 [Ornithodoros turicata]|uniref:carboxypeptidase inhibitor SmCI-like isoform X2 n=1 Tax=Ornithodoros turicata TaxID=34597 RepID=UPI003138AC0D
MRVLQLSLLTLLFQIMYASASPEDSDYNSYEDNESTEEINRWCSMDVNFGQRCSTPNATTRYYHDNATHTCKQFHYEGCNGNENNFESKLVCMRMCRYDGEEVPSEEDTSEEAVIPTVCTRTPANSHRVNSRRCPTKGKRRFFYNASASTCEAVRCTGPAQNYFETKKECKRRCIEIPKTVCGLKEQAGPCRAKLRKWYFNGETDNCEQFDYGGCYGNGNKFESKDACKNECMKKRGVAKPRLSRLGNIE